jgi:ABC-2 type transport system permease protein
MWLRQMKRYVRYRSRIAVTLIQPLLFLFILGFGFKNIEFPGMESENYIHFFVSGIIAMSILFSSMFAGISVLWDKQFGFLQEVLVAPVSRFSIIIGRTLGGATTALLQGFIILIIVFILGVPFPGLFRLLMTITFMILIAINSVGFGLILASKMRDMQSFPLIMNLVMMPLILVSSAFFPLKNLPPIAFNVAKFNPIFYMVDGIRGSLLGRDSVHSPIMNLVILLILCIFIMALGNYFFSKNEI